MAWIVGLVTEAEIAELTRRGWEVEDAEKHNIVGRDRLIDVDPEDKTFKAVVVYVDTNLFEIMDGPDWEGGQEK